MRVEYGVSLERAETVFGAYPETDPWTEKLILEHGVALEIAERLCTEPGPDENIPYRGIAERNVSKPFSYEGVNGSNIEMRLGLLRQNEYEHDSFIYEAPLETVEVFIRSEYSRDETWTKMGQINPLGVRSSYDKSSNRHGSELISLEVVMNAIFAADKQLSPPAETPPPSIFQRLIARLS